MNEAAELIGVGLVALVLGLLGLLLPLSYNPLQLRRSWRGLVSEQTNRRIPKLVGGFLAGSGVIIAAVGIVQELEEPVAPPAPPVRCGASPTGRGGPMCQVPSGSYPMGCRRDDTICRDRAGKVEYPDEAPFHQVELDAFHIDEHEVTVAEYARCVAESTCNRPEGPFPYGSNWDDEAKAQHPANYLTWSEASTYCSWVGKRLPTEAEWEAAARGREARIYPWGGNGYDIDPAVADLPSEAGTAAVCSRPEGKSLFGACDMSGNVSEWVADWYDEKAYTSTDRKNPTGPDHGERRVVRGGGWYASGARYLRTSGRYSKLPEDRSATTGFRCAWSESDAPDAAMP